MPERVFIAIENRMVRSSQHGGFISPRKWKLWLIMPCIHHKIVLLVVLFVTAEGF